MVAYTQIFSTHLKVQFLFASYLFKMLSSATMLKNQSHVFSTTVFIITEMKLIVCKFIWANLLLSPSNMSLFVIPFHYTLCH